MIESEVLAGDVLARKISSQHPEDDSNYEDEDVDEVEEDAEDTDGDGEVSVYWLVSILVNILPID